MRPEREAGFTIIEFMIVMVIVGVLMAIIIPKWESGRERAYVASMQVDLHHLANFQEVHAADNLRYSTDANALITVSPGVSVVIHSASRSGWAATAMHSGTSISCGIAVGDGANPVDAAAAIGRTVCR